MNTRIKGYFYFTSSKVNGLTLTKKVSELGCEHHACFMRHFDSQEDVHGCSCMQLLCQVSLVLKFIKKGGDGGGMGANFRNSDSQIKRTFSLNFIRMKLAYI